MMVACHLVFMIVACRLPSCAHCALPIKNLRAFLPFHDLERIDLECITTESTETTENGHSIDILPVSLPYRSKMDVYRKTHPERVCAALPLFYVFSSCFMFS
jgi:hypothetical protein